MQYTVVISDYTKEAIEKGIGKETGIEFFIHAMFKEQITNSHTIEIETGNHGPGTQILTTRYFQEIKNALRLVDCGDFYLRYQGAMKTENVITWRLKVDMKKKSSPIPSKNALPQEPEKKKEEMTTAEIIEHIETEEPVVAEVEKEEMKGMIEESGTPPSYFVPKGGRKNKKKIKPKEV